MMKTKEDDYGSFAVLVVRDAELMLGFYQNVLGMKLVHTDDGDEGLTKYYLAFSGGMLKLLAYDEPPELNTTEFSAVTGYAYNTYLVTNMAELFKTLEENRVKIVSPPQPTGNGQTWMIALDPEGNTIEMAGTG